MRVFKINGINGSGEMGMNLYVHTLTMKNVPIQTTPASGLIRDTADRGG
jgi:hypothetical protein